MDSLDARLRRPVGVKAIGRNLGSVVYGEPAFCVSCGRLDGYVTVGLPPGVIYLCGTCEGKYGVPPEMTARPDLDKETHGLV
jgi:hypothetical protein